MYLLCEVGGTACALSLRHVVEIMRPRPLETLAGAPEFVLGTAIIRGAATPVVDASQLLLGSRGKPSRLVLLRVDQRTVALAVDAVVSTLALADDSLSDSPPLLSPNLPAVDALSTLDAKLLLVLQAGRLLPKDLRLDGGEGAG